MSFFSREESINSGEPIELYQFTNGTQGWYYTSSADDIAYLGNDYVAVPIERSEIVVTREVGKAQLTIKIPKSLPLALTYIQAPPDGQTLLQILRYHVSDTQYLTYWTGRLTAVELSDSDGTITCDSDFTLSNGLGARATFAIPCRHALYDAGCTVNASAFSATGTLSSAAGATLQSPTFSSETNGAWAGGSITITVGGVSYSRMILTHVTTTITLMYPIPGLLGGEGFTVYQGCDHSLDGANGCAKFRNTENHGGWPWKPLVNPWDGTSL